MCCLKGSAKKNEGISIMVDEMLSGTYEDKKPLSKEDLKIILNKIAIMTYNTKLYEKRNLQAQRSKLLKNGLNNNYLELLTNTKKLEEEVNNAVKAQVLEDYKVPQESYDAVKQSEDAKEVKEAVIGTLHQAIRDNRIKLGLTEKLSIELGQKYQSEYDKTNFLLNSNPEMASKLSVIYDDTQIVNYVEVMVADNMYNQFKLLPIEIQAFIEEN